MTFEDMMDVSAQMEEGFLGMGIKAEDARYVRPNAAVTNIVTSMNPRQLLHVLSLTCASDAQWKIRDIAWAMFACAKLVAPSIFETLPGVGANSYMRERTAKLDSAVKQAEPVFARSQAGKLVQIPMEQVGLEHAVRPFVRKIQRE